MQSNVIIFVSKRVSVTLGWMWRCFERVIVFIVQSSYKTEAQLQKMDENINKGPNMEILLHERKRKIELECLVMQELMEEQGYVFVL